MGFSLKVVGHFKRGSTGTLGASSLVSPQALSHPASALPLSSFRWVSEAAALAGLSTLRVIAAVSTAVTCPVWYENMSGY